jgi:hypothetical protein
MVQARDESEREDQGEHVMVKGEDMVQARDQGWKRRLRGFQIILGEVI